MNNNEQVKNILRERCSNILRESVFFVQQKLTLNTKSL